MKEDKSSQIKKKSLDRCTPNIKIGGLYELKLFKIIIVKYSGDKIAVADYF